MQASPETSPHVQRRLGDQEGPPLPDRPEPVTRAAYLLEAGLGVAGREAVAQHLRTRCCPGPKEEVGAQSPPEPAALPTPPAPLFQTPRLSRPTRPRGCGPPRRELGPVWQENSKHLTETLWALTLSWAHLGSCPHLLVQAVSMKRVRGACKSCRAEVRRDRLSLGSAPDPE